MKEDIEEIEKQIGPIWVGENLLLYFITPVTIGN